MSLKPTATLALTCVLAACSAGERDDLPERVSAAGLSKEVSPQELVLVTLDANPALVDGNFQASAGLDVGQSRADLGYVVHTHIGGNFASATTPVDRISVYVDRTLPPWLAARYSWSVWRSDDNVEWASVAPQTSVAFDATHARFDISIPRTGSRFLKVVVRPLPPDLTADPQCAHVFVTEIEFYAAAPAG